MKFLFNFLIISLTACIARRLRLSGIRDGSIDVVHIKPFESFYLEIFGKNLPSSGFYLTTSARCEDANRTDLGKQDTVVLSSSQTFDRYLQINVENGLSFKADSKFYHLCLKNSNSDISKYLTITESQETSNFYWSTILICTYCVLMSAFSSGMTIGYMKFSIADLNRMLDCQEPVRTRASRILRFRKRSNWLVCTLSMFGTLHSVIFTTQVEDALSETKYSEVLSVIVPTLILFFFAEFIPQALCNSKFGFVLASGLWPLTVVCFFICAPIAWPASKIIDFFLGRDVREVLTEEEKMNIIRNMAKNANWKERKILEKTTTFSSKTVKEVMTPIDKVFLLPSNQRLNKITILTLVEKGFTRIPVKDIKNRNNIYAVLNIKEVISYDLSNSPTVDLIVARTERKSTKMRYVIADMKVQQLMQQMRTGGFHIATVIKFYHTAYKVIGIITIEDILGQIFGEIEKNYEKSTNYRYGQTNDDNIVMIWCREAGTDPKYPLSFSQQLLVIQCLLEECPILKKLGVGVVQAKQLLSSDRIQTKTENEKIMFSDDLLIVLWEGVVEIVRDGETVSQELHVKRIEELENLDFSRGVDYIETNVQAFICGKQMLKEVVRELKLNVENVEIHEEIVEVTCKSKCSFFEIRVSDVTDVINDSESLNFRVDETLLNSRLPQQHRSIFSNLKLHHYGFISGTPSPTDSSSKEPIKPFDMENSRLLTVHNINKAFKKSNRRPNNF